jgi:hypothetical protein
MTIETWLHQILTGSPLPTTLGENIFPVQAPPNQPGYYSVYQVVSSPPILTQENTDGTRVWIYQFRQYGPTYATVASQTQELKNFLTTYKDGPARPGIMGIIEINTMDLPTAIESRNFGRVLQVQIFENLT